MKKETEKLLRGYLTETVELARKPISYGFTTQEVVDKIIPNIDSLLDNERPDTVDECVVMIRKIAKNTLNCKVDVNITYHD